MSYTAQLTDAAQAFHERMFPGYVSDFLRTDPEFIERFDNFAFDDVIAATPLLDDREFLIQVVSNNVPFIGYPRSLNAMAVVEEVTGKHE